MNVHKTFRRPPGRLLNVLSTLNLSPVSTGYSFIEEGKIDISNHESQNLSTVEKKSLGPCPISVSNGDDLEEVKLFTKH